VATACQSVTKLGRALVKAVGARCKIPLCSSVPCLSKEKLGSVDVALLGSLKLYLLFRANTHTSSLPNPDLSVCPNKGCITRSISGRRIPCRSPAPGIVCKGRALYVLV
jgi:hypothetical protein